MTIINPNSIAGITSLTAEADVMNFYKSNGTLGSLQLNGCNFNTTNGISTFNNLVVGGTLTYEDVKNVDSIGIITARGGLNVTANTDTDTLNVSGVSTFVGNAKFESLSGSGCIVTNSSSGSGGILQDSANHTISGSTLNTVDIVAQGNITVADKIIHRSDTNTTIRFPSNDTITAETDGAERLRITSAGTAQFKGNIEVDTGSAGMIDFGDITSAYGRLYADSTGTFIGSKSNHALILRTNNTERLRIDTSGRLLLGTTAGWGSDVKLHLGSSANTYAVITSGTTHNLSLIHI